MPLAVELADVGKTLGVLVALATAYLLIAATFEKGREHLRAVRRFFRPDPAPSKPPPRAPVIVLGAPSYHLSKEPIPNERRLMPRQLLTALEVGYVIENKEAGVTVTDVETGARRKDDGREERFEAFKAAGLAPLERAPVRNFVLASSFFNDLTEQEYQAAFIWWARFSDPEGNRWESVYDPATEQHSRRLLDAE